MVGSFLGMIFWFPLLLELLKNSGQLCLKSFPRIYRLEFLKNYKFIYFKTKNHLAVNYGNRLQYSDVFFPLSLCFTPIPWQKNTAVLIPQKKHPVGSHPAQEANGREKFLEIHCS